MLLTGPIRLERFGDIDLVDSFFGSLKEDYAEFGDWFARKRDKEAWILRADGQVRAFLYLKEELGTLDDIEPSRPHARRLKAGTMKVDAHGTRLGERFLRLMFDEALDRRVEEIYVTVFPKHEGLIELLVRWGFELQGTKTTANGTENVYVKPMSPAARSLYRDYPFVNATGRPKRLLSILPEYHTRLFPDSKLNTESSDIITDLSHTNSIFKVYISWSHEVRNWGRGDVVVIYRMKDRDRRPAGWYSSVATSVCVVDKVKAGPDWESEERFIRRCASYSVFSEEELQGFWRKNRDRLTAIRMTYNFALPKRPNRKALAEEAGLDETMRWTAISLTDPQFSEILRLGQADERLVVDKT